MFCLYEIVNIKTNTKYIGCSKDVKRRWHWHINKLNSNKHGNQFLQRSWNKYESSSFVFNIIETVDTIELMYIREKQLILECNNKFNLAAGGHGGDTISNHPHIEKIKQKMSAAKKIRYQKEDTIERMKYNAFKNLSADQYVDQCKKWSSVKKGPGNGRFKHNTPIARIDIKTNEIIQIYPYICILKDYGFNGKYAKLCAEGHRSYKTHKGYIWKYIQTN